MANINSARTGLRNRVAIGVIMVGAFLLVLQTIAVLFIVEYQEENFIDRILLDEAERVLSRAPGDVPGGLIRYIVRTPEDGAALPEYLRELGPGLHEFYIGEREFHVDVQPTQDGVYYLLYDATRHEDRVNEFRIFMLFGVAVSIAVLVWAGIWVAGRLVRQVTDLSRRVAKLDPAVAQPVLAPDYRDAEVVTLAQALDEYADRVAELLGREKEFTANVSHELRTPLTIIKSSCELLLNDASLNEKSRSRIQRVLEGTDRMVEVVEALLLLAREAPMAARESVALYEMVSEIAAQFDSALEAKGIGLEIDIPEGAVLSVHRTALALLVGNLLKNALIYTDHGRITVRYDGYALSVNDSGIGIAAEDVPHIFERSFRGRNARREGSGIGLAIVRRLCTRFGWSIGVASQPGEGTTFTVDFGPSELA